MEGLDLGAIVSSIAAQGPLVGFLFYLFVQNGKKLDSKDIEIADLNKELRENQEKYLNKSYELTTQTNTVLTAVKEAFKGA